jgi:hypothetical protein
LLWILYYPETNVLITECFVLPFLLSKLVKISSVIVLLYQLSKLVNLCSKACVYILCHSDISLIAVIPTVGVSAKAILVVVKEVVVVIVVFKAVVSVAVIAITVVYRFLRTFVLIDRLCFAKGVLTSFSL